MTERLIQARDVMQSLPHAQSLGMIVTETAEGSATITMPYDTRLIGEERWQAEVSRQTGRAMHMRPFPWWQLTLLSPFWELARELRKMRYLYETPHRLDAAPLNALLPDFQTSSLVQVVAAHLAAKASELHLDPQGAVAGGFGQN